MSNYLAKGNYGCVIKPNLRCDGKIGDNKQISKFFFKKRDYLKEKKLHKMIEKIDKKNKYTIKMISSCKVKLTKDIISKIKDFRKCKFTDYKMDKIYQIIYEYGGDDLFILLKNIKEINRFNIYNFLQKFINIFEFIYLLNKKKLIHFDIRTPNILYNIEKEKINIIDFGVLRTHKNIKKYFTNIFNNQVHPNYPNELNIISKSFYKIFHRDLRKYNLNSNEFVNIIIKNNLYDLKLKYKNNKNRYFKEVLKKIQEIYDYFDKDMYIEFEKDHDFYKKLFKDIKKNNPNNYEKIYGKIDVYTLGIVLLEMLFHFFNNTTNNPYITKIPLKLFDLIKKMIILNPSKRISIKNALKEFKLIMKI